MIHHGDCLDIMPTLDAESIDAIVTDPPYGLEFMGKAWDSFRVDDTGTNRHRGTRVGAKGDIQERDGSTVFGRTRVSLGGGERATTNRCVGCGKRDQFRNAHACPEGTQWRKEIIDPHAAPPASLAYSEWCREWAREALRVAKPGAYLLAFGGTRTVHRLACAVEDAGWIIRDLLVWGYASGFPKGKANLKPAWEPIVMARKPGPLRPLEIDGCRIGMSDEDRDAARVPQPSSGSPFQVQTRGTGTGRNGEVNEPHPLGRWPANVILTDPIFDGGWDGVVGGGETAPGAFGLRARAGDTWGAGIPTSDAVTAIDKIGGYNDSGTYSRFSLVPKAARSDREPVLGGLSLVKGGSLSGAETRPDRPTNHPMRGNHHPTVKPTDLMRHLVRLVTPQGGTVLDPFLGSGTTALAAELEGFAWVGIEREAEYVQIAEARLNGTQRGMAL